MFLQPFIFFLPGGVVTVVEIVVNNVVTGVVPSIKWEKYRKYENMKGIPGNFDIEGALKIFKN